MIGSLEQQTATRRLLLQQAQGLGPFHIFLPAIAVGVPFEIGGDRGHRPVDRAAKLGAVRKMHSSGSSARVTCF